MPVVRVRARANVVHDSIPRDAERRLEREARGAISRGTRFMRSLAYANINKRTGRTAGTIRSVLAGLTGYVGSDDRVAGYLEFGTAPHVITPSTRRALFWPGARHPVAFVRHPGTRPYRWLERAGESAGQYTKGELRVAFGRVFGL